MSHLQSLILAVTMSLSVSMSAHAEWNADWTAHKKISINTQGVNPGVDHFPVVIRLHSGNFDFSTVNDDGSDLRFIGADDKTELKYHIEKFDAVNELAVIWVQVPKIDAAAKDTFITVYSGNEKATASADAKATWDTNTVAAFHFAEKTQLADSSATSTSLTGAASVDKAALLGEAVTLAGTPLTIAANPALKLSATTGYTWSAWIKPASLPQSATLYAQGGVTLKLDAQKLTLASGAANLSGGELKAAAWQHIAFTLEAGKANLYVNGVSVGAGDLPVADTQADIQLGEGFTGGLDEVEIANVARAESWVKLAASSQGADSKLITVEAGDEAGGEEGGTSYITILFNSLTPDAEAVIAILSVMFAISVYVMVQKFRLVSRTDKDNKRFLAKFQNAGTDLLNLDKGEKYEHSALFKLYAAGLREIKKREHDGQKIQLSGASIDAIKAAVDADLVRETQRQNAGMVLLTIAISGGPFLGLLGTVVGVMITFAAIAAAGDVNVNAIAPGIAAALLATVAGLGVAIPALFGYNYLASRVKNITIEMQIFVDEFITRIAELYGKE
ncbi:MAG TPA: MotA/TolQ/ExbB proton channel family protein [Methylophilaceae bacterium]